MIKPICFLKRKPGMGGGDFRDHWLNDYGPLVRSSPDLARHIVRYEQNHRLDADYERESGGGLDGGRDPQPPATQRHSTFLHNSEKARQIS